MSITKYEGAEAPAVSSTERAMSLVEWADEARAAYTLAETLAQTPFAGSWKGDPAAASAAILRGAEVGLTPVTSLAAFDNIQGTPAPKAMTLRALVQAAGHGLEIVEETEERAVARYRRKGQTEWQETEFTLEDAKRMGLLGKDNWQKQPRTMLVARVTSKAARMVASDVILGIGYSSEELLDEGPQYATPAAPRRGLGAALAGPTTAEQVEATKPPPQTDDEMLDVTGDLAKAMFAGLNEAIVPPEGVTWTKDQARAERLDYCSGALGRVIESSDQMTAGDARTVLRMLAED